jgi:hypothetical protein
MSELWTGSLTPRPSSAPARAMASITIVTENAVRTVNEPSTMPAMMMMLMRLKRSAK